MSAGFALEPIRGCRELTERLEPVYLKPLDRIDWYKHPQASGLGILWNVPSDSAAHRRRSRPSDPQE